MLKRIGIGLLVFICSVSGWAADCACQAGGECNCLSTCGCDHPSRAPAGVTGDHVHHRGGWMVSYRYMAMHMEGIGGGDVSGYPMRPVQMDMQMHMVGAMYAPHDRLTLALMLPYAIKDMDMVMGPMSMPMAQHTEGLGDMRLVGIYNLWSSSAQQVLLNLALSLPTGSIDKENATGVRLSYPMQLGSGSYGIVPGVTYTGLYREWGWGAQATAAAQLNENKHDYTLGNRYDLQGWLLRDLCHASAVSLRLNGWHRDNIDGADPSLNPVATPGADPNLRAATRLDLLAGIDYRAGVARFALEGGVPIYQNLDGPQLETDWIVNAGWQLSF